MKLVILLVILFTINSVKYQEAKIRPTKLTCEYLENPTVVDVPNPRLSWINIAKKGERGQLQTAWQIKVSSAKEKMGLADLWDSKKVISDESTRMQYAGKPLLSHQECWWQVRTWDKENNVSAWSEPAMWRMGILNADEWKANWIGAPWQGEETLPIPQGSRNAKLENYGPPAPLLRKEFTVEKKVAKAIAYVTGLGYFEFYVNGNKIGGDVLVPNQTNYGKRLGLPDRFISLDDNFKEYKVMYLSYDITDKLKEGKNVIGSILGNGFYNPAKGWAEGYGSPRFIGQVHISYTDGSEDIIVSDKSWKASKSAILMNMVYYGEYYDARKEQQGWSIPSFDDGKWENVAIKKAPFGKLVAHTAHTDKITERIAPVSIKKMDNGNYLVDFGIEISGWVRLNNVEAPAGHKIDIKFNSSDFSGDNSYIFKGDGLESYAPRFNWFVFSSIEISNWYGELKSSHLTAEAVNTFVEVSAKFETSNQLLNDINKIWRRSQIDNMHGGIASDCPHRERSAYTGDAQAACVMVMHNYDAQNFYHKWVQDMLGAQNVATGYVPNGAPWQPGCGGGVAWGAAICIIPWEFYVQYGALDMLEDNYQGMKDYIEYMKKWVDEEGIMYSQRKGKDGKILKWFNLGDWVAPGKMPANEFVHTFYYWRCTDIVAKTAAILNNHKEAKIYANMAEKTKKAFHKRFYDEKNGTYGNGGGNILALKMGVPTNQKDKVIKALKKNIESNKGHLDTGIFGTKHFFEMLSENGLHDLAYEALNKKTEPSFGYWLELGATTTWEQWDGTNSRNHPMFGGGLVWMYRKLAGMNADPSHPGYKHIIFKPQFINDLDFVTYSNQTPYGKAGITWKQNGKMFKMDITVPVGSTATIYVPINNTNKLKEGGLLIDKIKEIHVESMNTKELVLKVGSGEYHFEF